MKTLAFITLIFLSFFCYSQSPQDITLVNNATVTTDKTYSQYVPENYKWSLQVNWTDASATDGVIKIKVSGNGINYANYADMDSVICSTASGFAIFEDFYFSHKFIQVSYTENSNTTIKLTSKLFLKP